MSLHTQEKSHSHDPLPTDSPDSSSERRAWAVARACAGVTFLLYLSLIFVARGLSSAEPSFAGEVFPGIPVYTKEEIYASGGTEVHTRAALLFLPLVAALFALYAVTLNALRDVESKALSRFAYGAGAAFLLLYLFSPVMLSTDVHAYGMYGRVFAVYGANPYNTTSPLPPDDPYLQLYGLSYLASWYGPLWTLISGGIARMSGEAVGVSVLLFRLTAIFAMLGMGALLWAGLRRFSPSKVSQGIVFLLWNPLLVLETGLSGHNDSVMLLFVLLGLWMHLRGWKTGAVAAMAASTLIKFLTGLILPLYILMVVRQLPTWRERGIFLAKSAAVGGLALFCLVTFTKGNEDVPVMRTVMAPDFYLNNYHEVIFHGLRRAMGEEEETIRAPLSYGPWWAEAREPKQLFSAPSPDAEAIGPVSTGSRFLVLAPNMTDWLYVYDTGTRRKGYLDSSSGVEAIERPPEAASDAEALRVEKGKLGDPVVRRANLWVRVMMWTLFGAFYAYALWRVRDFGSFLVTSVLAMLAAYYLILTEIWPWYVNWAVALAALVPSHRVARYVALLSMFALVMYATIGYGGSDHEWIYAYRGVITFLLPAVLFGIYTLIARRRGARPAV